VPLDHPVHPASAMCPKYDTVVGAGHNGLVLATGATLAIGGLMFLWLSLVSYFGHIALAG
jgi:hypothetical protein